jgi:1,4-alpha-glucan branching enzyme
MAQVTFEYLTGLRSPFFLNARLSGSWDGSGRYSEQWTTVPMQAFTAEDGCPAFRATVSLDDGQINREFRWGVFVDTPERPNVWGVPTEINDTVSRERYRIFTLGVGPQTQRFYFTHCRRLGANKRTMANRQDPAIRFSVWAPNARNVELVRGEIAGGYIFNNGTTFGGQPIPPAIPMQPMGDGIWETRPDEAALADFRQFDHTAYMYRITKDDGSVVYRTDIYSRCQIGSGGVDPDAAGAQWSGRRQDLDGSRSCSVVIDPEQVTREFQERDAAGNAVWPETLRLTEADFWASEFDPARPLPTRIEDLVIYELHANGLGVDRGVDHGTLEDALRLIPYLRDLGINCVELMPMSEFQARGGWGYSTSHYFAIEYADGGRDQFKHFVRECHRNGIAVILDVVYNHYAQDAERSEWLYDSAAHERSIYYWYEGRPSDYPVYERAAEEFVRAPRPGERDPPQPGHGGYLNNGSSGYAPRWWDEMVRKMFVSSAAAFVSEFHFDGFRVDLTQAIHRDNNLEADGRSVGAANEFGAKFLREWANTLRSIKPNVFLIAEDHSGWPAVTHPTESGGLGFDATWYADFYHHLIGDVQNGSRARLILVAGSGYDGPLAMHWFAGALAAAADRGVVYHESHDEVGNDEQHRSRRTIVAAVNDDPLVGDTRRWAEARVRFAAGMTLLSPGVPMFFMGEEVGATRQYRYEDFGTEEFRRRREDFPAMRQGSGANLFRYYAELIRLRLARPALRSRNVEILFPSDPDRVIAFRRWEGPEELLVIGSLNNQAFGDGYSIRNSRIADGQWREIFNSDATVYGGWGITNPDTRASAGGVFTPRLPANSVLVFQRQ